MQLRHLTEDPGEPGGITLAEPRARTWKAGIQQKTRVKRGGVSAKMLSSARRAFAQLTGACSQFRFI